MKLVFELVINVRINIKIVEAFVQKRFIGRVTTIILHYCPILCVLMLHSKLVETLLLSLLSYLKTPNI